MDRCRAARRDRGSAFLQERARVRGCIFGRSRLPGPCRETGRGGSGRVGGGGPRRSAARAIARLDDTMTRVVCLGAGALDYPEGKGGGHTWVFLNWALGLRAVGCRVIWLESMPSRISVGVARERLAILRRSLHHYGLEEIALGSSNGEPVAAELSDECLSSVDAAAEADLLL